MIVYVHNASCLNGLTSDNYSYHNYYKGYLGCRKNKASYDPMWITNEFPVTGAQNTNIEKITICTRAAELHAKLEAASIHWLVVTEDDGLKLRKLVRVLHHVSLMDSLLQTGHLLKEIRSLNCLLFLGAGFSIPANLPSWAVLLQEAGGLTLQ